MSTLEKASSEYQPQTYQQALVLPLILGLFAGLCWAAVLSGYGALWLSAGISTLLYYGLLSHGLRGLSSLRELRFRLSFILALLWPLFSLALFWLVR